MRREKGIGKTCSMGTCFTPNPTFSVRLSTAH